MRKRHTGKPRSLHIRSRRATPATEEGLSQRRYDRDGFEFLYRLAASCWHPSRYTHTLFVAIVASLQALQAGRRATPATEEGLSQRRYDRDGFEFLYRLAASCWRPSRYTHTLFVAIVASLRALQAGPARNARDGRRALATGGDRNVFEVFLPTSCQVLMPKSMLAHPFRCVLASLRALQAGRRATPATEEGSRNDATNATFLKVFYRLVAKR
jgi:hypothetical protein